MEQTLVLLKPDAIQRGLAGEIITRLERVGLKIVGAKMVAPDRKHYHTHYEDIGQVISRRGQEVFDVTVDFMLNGPVLALVFEGVEAVDLVRKLVGGTEPKAAQPGTIRGDFSHMSFTYANSRGKTIPNLIHASGDPAEAKKEVAHWFKPAELFNYDTVHQKYTF